MFYANKTFPVLKIEKLTFDRDIFPLILSNSIPAAIQMSITSLISLTITRLVNTFGEYAAAGYSVATRIDSFALLPLESMSMTLSTFAGQNTGANQDERARKGHRSTLAIMLGVAVFASSFMLIFGKQMMSLFVNNTEKGALEIVNYGWDYLSVIGLFYVLHALFFSYNGFFRGVGDAVIVMILTISSLSIRAIFSYFFTNRFSMGPEAIGWAIPIGWAICSVIAIIYFRKGLWKEKRRVKT
jgi:Na+-driven multidrug efflux pump